jgi:hypothetical protein
MPPRRNLAAVPKKSRKPSPDLRLSVASSVEAMVWLSDSDRALADVAMKLAEQIEEATERAALLEQLWSEVRGDKPLSQKLAKLEAMCDLTKTVGWLGPQLQGVLRDLGGTPAARQAMQLDKPIGGRLADLRAAAAGKRDAAAVDSAAPSADA